MYEIETKKFTLLLRGPDGTAVEVIPSCGALLNGFSTPVRGTTLQVIDGIADPSRAKELIVPAFQSAKLSPYVCRVREGKYRFQGQTYRLGKFSLGEHAIHGLLFDLPFLVTETWTSGESAVVSLALSYHGEDPGYPFEYDCRVRYTLRGTSLRLDTEIENMNDRPMPLADGWHPYFTLGKKVDELELQFAGPELLEFDNLIPTGRTLKNTRFLQRERIGSVELDNAFALDEKAPNPRCILRDPEAQVQVEIAPDRHYPILQLYTPPHRRSIAIENLSGAPDNFNNGIGLVELQPGGLQQFSTTYTIRAKP